MKPELSPRQYGLLLMTTMIGVGLKPLAHDLPLVAHRDGWVSVLIGGAIMWCGYAMITALVNRYPGQSFTAMTAKILGRWAGGALALGYAGLWAASGGLTIRFFAELLKVGFLPRTPVWATIAMFIGTTTLLACGDIQRLARLRELLAPALMGVYLLYLIVALPKVQLTNLLPVFEYGPRGALAGVPLTFWSIAGYETALVAAAHITDRRKLLRSGTLAMLVALFVPLTIQIAVTGIFGPAMAVRFTFPSDETLKFVDLPGQILQRFDLFVIAFWILAIINAASGMQHAAATTLRELTRWTRGWIAFGLGLLIYVVAVRAQSTPQLYSLVRGMSIAWFAASVVMPGLLWGISVLRGGQSHGKTG